MVIITQVSSYLLEQQLLYGEGEQYISKYVLLFEVILIYAVCLVLHYNIMYGIPNYLLLIMNVTVGFYSNYDNDGFGINLLG